MTLRPMIMPAMHVRALRQKQGNLPTRNARCIALVPNSFGSKFKGVHHQRASCLFGQNTRVEGFVGLVKLKDFYSFLEDQPGEIAERIFESNVRGYQQDSKINE